MSRPIAPDPSADPLDDELGAATPNGEGELPAVDLAALPIAGLTRRRMALIAAALLAAWIVLAFARQVAEASDAATRSQDIATANAMLRIEVAAMERELEAIARQRFIEQQARAHGVGGAEEIAFTLAPDSPPLADDAPGSSAVRLGADAERVSPLERWLTVLFGPSA
jgi:cell division protein FtsB